MIASRRWMNQLPFALALSSLGFLLWSAFLAVNYPHDGTISYSRAGVITAVDDHFEQENSLQVGDRIISVNGVQFEDAEPFYRNYHPEDKATIVINREGEEKTLQIKLTSAPRDVLAAPFVTLLVALIFWGVGVGVKTFQPSDVASDLFFLVCQVSAILLAAGLASGIGPDWASNLFNFSLWLLGPLAVNFHLYFPQTTTVRWRFYLLSILYTIVLASAIPYFIWGVQRIPDNPLVSQFLSWNLLFLSANLLVVIGLLIYVYRRTASPGVRGKIRIVVLGGILGLLSAISLIIIPNETLGSPIIPYTYSFLLLGITPITYSYAIIRHHLIRIDKHINRGATYILVFSVLAGFYTVLYSALHRILLISNSVEPVINTLLVLLLAGIFTPLRQSMQKFVDRVFYGGWYDYRSAVTSITQGLEQVTDLNNLAFSASDRLVKTLQLENVCAFLRDLEGEFSVIQIAPQKLIPSQEGSGYSTLPKNSLSYLLNVGAIERTSLRRSLSEVSLSPEERQLLDSEQANLWIPVIGHGQVLGLLALGPKLGGDVFSGEDMDILRIVARQLGPLIENIHLVTQLRQYAAELEQRVEERTAELHAAKEHVEAVLSSVGDGVIVTDLTGKIITVNHAFEEQSGFFEEEVLNKEIYDLLTTQEEQESNGEIRAALSTQGSWYGELRALHKSGRRYDVQLTIASIRDLSGEIVGYVGSQRDITQAKQLERLKDQFILEVSHELRTPVTNMGLFLDLLERGRPEKRSDYLSTLKNEVNQLAHMIEDILDLSRLEIGKQKKAAMVSVDLNLLAEQVISAHTPLAHEGGLVLDFVPAQALPPVRGEPNQLSRVITNLLSNAIRYTPAGCVWVRTFANGEGVCLEVQDTGIGIDPEDYPHLFERFYRGKKVSQSRMMGSGLGLALVKEIVDIHEGRIEWQSENGRGSTFRVWLPRI